MSDEPRSLPLHGARVLDLSGRIGAYCTKVLADLGADVLEVELPRGDRLRHVPPRRDGCDGPEAGLLFAYYHHNKRGITLDFEREDAVPILAELARSRDVVVASPCGGGTGLAGFVAAPPSLSWIHAGVLTCFITPYGLTGPCRDWKATPFTSFAMSGLMYPAGPVEGPPQAMPGQPLYDESGLWAAFIVQAVLRSPGALRGQVIDHSVHEVALFKQLGQDAYGTTARIKSRQTNFAAPPSGIWRCADGLVDIAVHTVDHWQSFVELLGRPEILTDPIYEDRGMRVQLFDLLTDVITKLLAALPADEFVRAAQAAGLACTVSQTPAEFISSEQVHARGFLTRSVRAGTGAVDLPGAPFVSSPSLMAFRRPAPRLGEHNEDVFCGELGLSTDEVEKWRSDGLV